MSSDSRELNGTVNFPLNSGCSSAQKDQIRRAMAIAADQILVNGDDFIDCLKDSVISDGQFGFAEDIVDLLAENLPTKFYCGAQADVCSGSSKTNACAPVNVSYEKLTFTDEFLDSPPA